MGCGGSSVNPPGFSGGGGGRIDIIIPLMIDRDSDGVAIDPVLVVEQDRDSDGVAVAPYAVYTRVKNFEHYVG